MTTFAVIGTYLMIGSFIGLFCWAQRDKDEWLANDPLISGLTILRIAILWPTFFVTLARIAWRRYGPR